MPSPERAYNALGSTLNLSVSKTSKITSKGNLIIGMSVSNNVVPLFYVICLRHQQQNYFRCLKHLLATR